MRFNLLKRNATTITNYEGAKAAKLTPEMELYAAVVTAGLSDNFYEKSPERIDRIRQLMETNNPEFIARLAVYARSEMHMRSIPLVLSVELAKQTSGTNIVRKTVGSVVQRADEIAELLAYYQMANKREGTKKLGRLSKQVQKGLGDAFNRFDEYQFSKYNRATDVTLKDALFLVHPKAKDDAQQAVFNKIAAGKLSTAYTWETELSGLGQNNFETKEERAIAVRIKWEELINSGKLGYMALLRNLRNIIQAGVSWDSITRVNSRIGSAEEVARSRQLPFRFVAAFREVKSIQSEAVPYILDALERALAASAANIKGFNDDSRVLIACDVSASMQQPVSPKSKVLLYDIGLVLAMLLKSRCSRAITGMFGSKWKVINMPSRSILVNVQEFYRREGEVGYATNGYLAIEYLRKKRIVMDKVMLFTDCQLHEARAGGTGLQEEWRKYKMVAPGAKLYLFDLAGYGNTPISIQADDVFLISGWSDKVFDMLAALDEGATVVEQIREMEL